MTVSVDGGSGVLALQVPREPRVLLGGIQAMPAGQIQLSTTAPVVTISAPTGGVHATVTALAPLAGAVIAATAPQFSVQVTRSSDGTETQLDVGVQIDVSTGTFATPLADFSAPATDIYGRAATVLSAPAPLIDGAYLWRARIGWDGNWNAWSDPIGPFTIDTTQGDAALAATTTVGGGVLGAGALWFARPPSIVPGQQVTLYGTNLVSSAATITVTRTDSGVVLDAGPGVASTVAATTNAYTSARTINVIAGPIDVEHDEVVFTMPLTVSPPGVLITVGSDVS